MLFDHTLSLVGYYTGNVNLSPTTRYGAPDPRNKDFVSAINMAPKSEGPGNINMLVSENKDNPKKLFFKEGCFDEEQIIFVPCISSWIKVNKSVDDPGAGVWARRVLATKKLLNQSKIAHKKYVNIQQLLHYDKTAEIKH